ncbi:MAG: ABC transporter ATP-binding protein [Thermodesulfobacteriota bacterium]
MSYISAENLTKQYGTGETSVTAVHDINFKVEAGEFVSIMGESGAGKSTLLSIMGTMNPPTSGRFVVDEIDIYTLGSEKRTDFRREFIGFVFQSFHLVSYLTVVENVMLPLTTVKASRRQKRGLAEAALDQVGLAGKGRRLPNQISGGEKERVAIARAIVNKPPVVLADEPTGNLDSATSHEVMGLLQNLNREGTTILMVTHSPDCAGYAQRMLRVSDGCLMKTDADRHAIHASKP